MPRHRKSPPLCEARLPLRASIFFSEKFSSASRVRASTTEGAQCARYAMPNARNRSACATPSQAFLSHGRKKPRSNCPKACAPLPTRGPSSSSSASVVSGNRAVLCDVFTHQIMRLRTNSNLRKMGHHDDLVRFSQIGQNVSQSKRNRTAHARVHFVEHKRVSLHPPHRAPP